jgi:NADH-quinone oxidoreductase subunit N
MDMLNQFILIFPEIVLTSVAMCMQLLAVFFKNHLQLISLLTIAVLLVLGTYIINFVPQGSIFIFSNSFEVSPGIYKLKSLVLFLSIMSIVIYKSLIKISDKAIKVEFITLILLSTVGVFISISARDFIILFCGLELQALSGYAMAAFNNKDVKSSEAGLKYFVLGSLISCLMLLGISFFYGFTGSIYFNDIRAALDGEFNIGLVVGAIFVLAAILFKLSAAPLHIWTPDVYEGAPVSAVTYFAVAQKVGVLIVLINFVTLVTGNYLRVSVDLIKIAAILSIFIGALGAMMQSSLKRLMAYSTILNVGYVLIAISLHSDEGFRSAIIYMVIYVIGTIGFFACLVALFGRKSDIASFADLQGISAERKTIAASIAIIMFSMIGLPPLAGFFGKYYVFYNAIIQGEVTLAVLGVISSVIAAFYYLKVVKYMYFMEAVEKTAIIPTNRGLLSVSVISVGFTLFFFIFASSYLL